MTIYIASKAQKALGGKPYAFNKSLSRSTPGDRRAFADNSFQPLFDAYGQPLNNESAKQWNTPAAYYQPTPAPASHPYYQPQPQQPQYYAPEGAPYIAQNKGPAYPSPHPAPAPQQECCYVVCQEEGKLIGDEGEGRTLLEPVAGKGGIWKWTIWLPLLFGATQIVLLFAILNIRSKPLIYKCPGSEECSGNTSVLFNSVKYDEAGCISIDGVTEVIVKGEDGLSKFFCMPSEIRTVEFTSNAEVLKGHPFEGVCESYGGKDMILYQNELYCLDSSQKLNDNSHCYLIVNTAKCS